MKFIRPKKKETPEAGAEPKFAFHVSRRDKNLLLSILKLYPATDPKAHRLSTGDHPKIKAGEEWLQEAMAGQRDNHAEKIARVLKNQGRLFHGDDDASQLVLTPEDLEWMLQALNDVRVGSWMRLGCPEMADARRAVLTEENAAHYTAMELSGYFQAALLEAFQSENG